MASVSEEKGHHTEVEQGCLACIQKGPGLNVPDTLFLEGSQTSQEGKTFG